MKEKIIEMLEMADDRKIRLIYFFLRGLLGY